MHPMPVADDAAAAEPVTGGGEATAAEGEGPEAEAEAVAAEGAPKENVAGRGAAGKVKACCGGCGGPLPAGDAAAAEPGKRRGETTAAAGGGLEAEAVAAEGAPKEKVAREGGATEEFKVCCGGCSKGAPPLPVGDAAAVVEPRRGASNAAAGGGLEADAVAAPTAPEEGWPKEKVTGGDDDWGAAEKTNSCCRGCGGCCRGCMHPMPVAAAAAAAAEPVTGGGEATAA